MMYYSERLFWLGFSIFGLTNHLIMKKLNLLYFLFLSIVFLPACKMTETSLEASLDVNKQRFSGPSYPDPSTTKTSVDENIAFSIVIPMSLGESKTGSFYNYQLVPDTNHSYASTGKGPASFMSLKYAQKQDDDFASHVYFKGGLELIGKRSSDGGATTTLNYLEIPLYALYKYRLEGAGAGSIFGGLGPYLAYGIGGNVSDGGTKISAFDGDNSFKRFDAGLGITAGYQIPQSFSFRLAYELGLANIQKSNFGDQAQNRSFSLNVGYPLDKLIHKIKGK